MTNFLCLDTESNGLFEFKNKETGEPIPADAPGQPRLASISMISVNAALEIEGEYSAFIKPDGWVMTPGATEVNGLTTEFLLANGVPVVEALDQYAARIAEGRTVIAHHAQHDLKQIRAELRRAGRPDLFEEAKNLCTMRTLMGIVKKPGGRGWPKLADCCRHFGIEPGDHTSKNDAMAVYLLMKKMHQIGLLREGSVHYAKQGYMKKQAAMPLKEVLEKSALRPSTT